ncbi:MAG: ABC transporter permease [Planctomycetes bacterium]|nr:ABC transporter permease [Planctomycetota bacterium]
MIRNTVLIAKKELLSYFVSPVTYVVAGLFFLTNALFFYLFIKEARGDFEAITGYFFSWLGFWFLALFIPPIITMRLVADELRLGTIEMLMTAPSSDLGVITGKFFAAQLYSFLLWAPTPILFMIAQWSGATFDWGIIWAGYLGAILVYSLFCAIGIFTSALSDSPLLSMLLALVFELALLFLMFLRSYSSAPYAEVISERYSLWHIMSETLLRGIVNTSHIVFLVSLTALFLFLATRALEFRRWK